MTRGFWRCFGGRGLTGVVIAVMACLLLICVAGADEPAATRPEPAPNEDKKEQEKPGTVEVRQLQPRPAAPLEPTPPARPPLDPRREAALLRTAQQLTEQSRDAFRRGLLRLPDHAQHLDVAFEIELRLASGRESLPDRIGALAAQRNVWRTEASELGRMRQPASRGWAADVVLARLLAARTEWALADAQRDRSAMSGAAQQVAALAREHFDLRKADFSVGLADSAAVTESILLLGGPVPPAPAGTPREPRFVQEWDLRRDMLQQFVAWAEPLTAKGAPAIDADLAFARMQLARTEALLADARGDRRAAQLRFKSADEQGQKWFETQWQFALTHTGSLFGVARAWRARQVLETELAATGASHAARARAGLQADLKRLEQLAARVTDLRGRQAADVAFVQALHGLEDLLQLPSAPPPIQASRDSRPTSEPERRRSESPRPAVPAPPPPQPPDRTGEAPSAPTEAIKPQP